MGIRNGAAKAGHTAREVTRLSSILNLLNRSEQPKASEEVLAHLSIAKGLFNRIVREDQWDWFTVSAQLGYPSRGLAHSIAFELSTLRSAIRYAHATCF